MSGHTWLLFAFAYLLTTLTPGSRRGRMSCAVLHSTGARGAVASILGNLLVQLVVTLW